MLSDGVVIECTAIAFNDMLSIIKKNALNVIFLHSNFWFLVLNRIRAKGSFAYKWYNYINKKQIFEINYFETFQTN